MAHDVTLGKLIEEGAQRDAIHVAIAPVIAAEKLFPGQDIGFVPGSPECVRHWHAVHDIVYVGIVDPFLKEAIQPEQRFWMWLYPNTITSLRHDWTHPAFASEDAVRGNAMELRKESEEWLRAFADELGDLSYDSVMEAARACNNHGCYMTEQGSTSWQDALYGREEEFWKHYERVTGERIRDNTARFFSCSC